MMRIICPIRHRGLCRNLAVFAAACIVLFGAAHALAQNHERTQIPPGPYRIAGTVVNAKAGNPLDHSRVTIASVKDRQSMQSVVTGDDGRFEFHVPAGKYSLEGATRGFISAAFNAHEQFSTAIVTGGDFDSENLILRLAPNAVLTGKVLDEFGEPVRDAQVMMYRETHSQGASRIVNFGASSTDDQGRYEVTSLEEGTYFVSAKAFPWYAIHPTSNAEDAANPPSQVDPSLDVVYPITYYGDVTEANEATPIPVRGGDRLEADIHVTPVPSLHIVLHLPQDSEGMGFPVLRKPGFDGNEQVENGNFENIAPGVYELNGVAAGRYTVRMPNSSGQLQEPVEVNLNGGELDPSAGRATGKIKAAVQIDAAASLPARFQVGLRNSKGRITVAQVDTKGEVNFPDVISGKYDVVAFSPTQTQAYSVVRIASEAGTISGHAVNVAPGASLTLAIEIVGSSVTVDGFAKRAGKGASGAMIVLVPKNPEANHDRFRRDQSDLDGSFTLPNVIPGSYTIVAIENGWDLDWSEPAVLAQYLAHGQPIEVGDRSPTPMHLADTVEVQAK